MVLLGTVNWYGVDHEVPQTTTISKFHRSRINTESNTPRLRIDGYKYPT